MAKKKKKAKKLSKSQREDREAIWFFGIILLLFASFLVPYFYKMSQMSFEFSNVSWSIEETKIGNIYHGRFASFGIANNTHNLYLRIDPRENDAVVEGKLTEFRIGSVLSFSPEFNSCRGDIPRAMVDFGQFLAGGVGVRNIIVATNDKNYSKERNMTFADCSFKERGIFIFELGNESKISVSKKNPACYTITAKNCTDISPIEKFMFRSVKDFRERFGWPKSK